MSCLTTEPVVKLALNLKLDDQDVVNTMYFERATAWTPSSAEALAVDVWDWWEASLAPILSNEISLQSIQVTDMTSASGFVVDYVAPGGAITGDLELQALPNNVSLVVSFRTGLRGRKNRGRNFLAGLSEASIASNAWDSTVRSGVQAAYTALQLDLTTQDPVIAQVVYSCTDSGGGGGTVGAAQPITDYIVNPIAATQRRRLPGRGR